ncbi:hypothetical protein NC653_002450 [Populus alba x Populus x berolinensis]|uniref:Uncharacterized protein n=1 Tax=Populus alba x Populus x berolinensis TaxID=444605 RepID=A0AAD6RPI7_9ROSI|nr:hypothetical protein NC653_002450 [Populus alba x Populus x berolinensis]
MENEQTRSTKPPDQIDMKTAYLVLLGDFLCLYDAGVHGRWKYFAVTIWKHIDVDEKVFKEVEFI